MIESDMCAKDLASSESSKESDGSTTSVSTSQDHTSPKSKNVQTQELLSPEALPKLLRTLTHTTFEHERFAAHELEVGIS